MPCFHSLNISPQISQKQPHGFLVRDLLITKAKGELPFRLGENMNLTNELSAYIGVRHSVVDSDSCG